MISFSVGGSTKRTESFLAKMAKGDFYSGIDSHAQRGVDALRAATPYDTGMTASMWEYDVVVENGGVTIWWLNTNVNGGFNVAIGLQYGHGTGTGGWIPGYDYINPALQGVFDEIADAVWKEVQSS